MCTHQPLCRRSAVEISGDQLLDLGGAESADLGDCHLALIAFIKAQIEPLRAATQKQYGPTTPGWTPCARRW